VRTPRAARSTSNAPPVGSRNSIGVREINRPQGLPNADQRLIDLKGHDRASSVTNPSRDRFCGRSTGKSGSQKQAASGLPMTSASASYLGLTANIHILIGAGRHQGSRMRLYREIAVNLVGVPSKNHSGRWRVRVLPESVGRIAEVTRDLKAGSRYLSNR
jgi:hypothetical protein